MRRELEGWLGRLEKLARSGRYTEEQWRLLELLTDGEPIPPELRGVKIPIELLREAAGLDDDEDSEPWDGDDPPYNA